MRYRFRSTKITGGFLVICMVISHIAVAQSDDDPWRLPPKPDYSALDTKYPNCDLTQTQVLVLRKCLVKLELYRSLTLEGYRTTELQSYSSQLTALDHKLERSRAQIDKEQYAELHDSIAIELKKCGADYLQPYKSYAEELKTDAHLISKRILQCTVTDC